MPLRRFVLVLLAIFFVCVDARGADLSRSEAAPLESYLGRFMQADRGNLYFGSPDKAAEARKILEYAIKFTQMDDPGKFTSCPRPDCPHGELRVEKKYIDEAVKRYFGHDPQNYPLLNGKGSPNFERGYYHASACENTGLKARVKEAKLQPVGLMFMRGDVLDNMGEVVDKFTALAWPTKYGLEDSLSLVSLVYDSSKKKK